MLCVLIELVDAIQTSNHNVCFYKENQEKHTKNIA